MKVVPSFDVEFAIWAKHWICFVIADCAQAALCELEESKKLEAEATLESKRLRESIESMQIDFHNERTKFVQESEALKERLAMTQTELKVRLQRVVQLNSGSPLCISGWHCALPPLAKPLLGKTPSTHSVCS